MTIMNETLKRQEEAYSQLAEYLRSALGDDIYPDEEVEAVMQAWEERLEKQSCPSAPNGRLEHLLHQYREATRGYEAAAYEDFFKSVVQPAALAIRGHISATWEDAVNLGVMREDDVLAVLFQSVIRHPYVASWLDEQPNAFWDRIKAVIDDVPGKGR